jgi:hypothetical protein
MVQAVVKGLQAAFGNLETLYLVSHDPQHYQWFMDRAFVFRIVLDQLRQATDAIEALDIPDAARERILTALQNAQRNVVVYTEVFGGAKYQVDIEEGKGVAIGDRAAVRMSETGDGCQMTRAQLRMSRYYLAYARQHKDASQALDNAQFEEIRCKWSRARV